MHGEVYIFGTKVISRLIGLIYENIAKMANKIFNVPNHLKFKISLGGHFEIQDGCHKTHEKKMEPTPVLFYGV